MQEKLAVTVLVITLALFALVVVLYQLVSENAQEYSQIVLKQHSSYDSRTIPYRRGDIVDRNKTYLATSEKVYNLILDPAQILSSAEEYLEPTVTALCDVFGYDRAEILEVINERSGSYYVRYERQLAAEQKEAFETKAAEMNKEFSNQKSSQKVKGVWFEDEYRRYYPYGASACNVVGFSYDEGKQGNGGIEQYYNEELIGTNGREYGYLDDESNMERVLKPASNGNMIVSTIDITIQRTVEKHIDEWMNDIGSQTAAALVMNPNNGEILAMASNRRFDLNNPRDLSALYSQAELEAMSDEEKSEAWNRQWRNFCVSDSFEPGSPMKALTIAACLDEGVIGQNETFECDGVEEVGGWAIKCVNIFGHKTLTVREVLMKSCNDSIMQMVARLGIKRYTLYQKNFGMGQRTGIDLPGEADNAALIFTEDTMGPTDLACNAFGQSFNCTMVQMAAAFASVINGGSYYEPHVVKQILNDQGSIVKEVEPKLVRETISEATSDFVRGALFDTVDSGTGKSAQVAGYKIGGKTGTAQKLPRADNNYVLSFIGFAPADNPQVLVYVVVDTPNLPGKEQAHSTFASNIFQKIMADILPYMNIFPETKQTGETGGDGASQAEETTAPDESAGGTTAEGENEGGMASETDEAGTTGSTETSASEEDETEGASETGSDVYEESIGEDGLGLPDRMPGDPR